ncbi:MAG: type IV pilus assembly protein PilM [Lentisphaerae bacterium]|jgi:type IV pilus assembly protein PilM|nr:type IV pilus assembly protein PilM [Lentisphaerota bacterium]
MARDERILAIDIGAASIKLCEFEFDKGSSINLALFAYREYEEELSEGTRMNVVSGLLRQMLAEGGFRARKALISLSGQTALMRFSRLPVVSYDKKAIRQLAEFEATNNIPFPINEVIWDYQLIVSPEAETIDVLSVVIKNEIVEQFTRAVMQVGLEPILVDVAPAACFNAARANGLGTDECVIIVNIGGRATNLLFAEGDRFFARNIPTAGNSITQQIAKEFGIGLPEAEELKRRHGFVALGGAYAEPESETAASVSKIIRTVMARLHGEISRSINVYRAQQKGGKPVKMYLTGGSSTLNYCDKFFEEKLGIPVEYFNPFTVVNLLPSVDRARLGEVAHMFSETIGLGLRYGSQCPIEFSLVPAAIQRQQNLSKKKPFFVISGLTILLTLGAFWFSVDETRKLYDAANAKMEPIHLELDTKWKTITGPEGAASSQLSQFNALGDLMLQRARWASVYNEIYRLKPNNLWINSIKPIYSEVTPYEPETVDLPSAMAEGGMMGGGMMGGGMFDGGSGGGMMMGNADPMAAEGAVPIAGLEIIGTCVMPYPDAKSMAWSATMGDRIEFDGIFQLEPKAAPASEEAPAAAEGEGETADAEAKPAEAPVELTPAQQKAKEEREAYARLRKSILSSQSPELAFEAALRQSPLFDADPTMTAITINSEIYSYPLERFGMVGRKSSRARAFKLQVKFLASLEVYNIPPPGLVRAGMGMDGGSPGGMMEPGEH